MTSFGARKAIINHNSYCIAYGGAMPADGLVPYGAMAFAGTAMIKASMHQIASAKKQVQNVAFQRSKLFILSKRIFK